MSKKDFTITNNTYKCFSDLTINCEMYVLVEYPLALPCTMQTKIFKLAHAKQNLMLVILEGDIIDKDTKHLSLNPEKTYSFEADKNNFKSSTTIHGQQVKLFSSKLAWIIAQQEIINNFTICLKETTKTLQTSLDKCIDNQRSIDAKI